MNQTTTQEQLKQHFLQAGNVLQVFLPLSNGQNRKFGFVSMKDKQQAEIAVNVLNESILCGNNIQVQIIQTQMELIQAQGNYQFQIEQIFSQNDLLEDEKAQQLNQFYQKCSEEDKFKLLILFNVDMFHAMKMQLNDISTVHERILLNIIELVVERISKISMFQDRTIDHFKILTYTDMNSSSLITKIEQILRKQIKTDTDNVNSHFSTPLEQLVCVYLSIMQNQDIEIAMLTICSEFIMQNISALIQNINNLIKQQHEQGNNEQLQNYENKIEWLIKMMQKIYNVVEHNYNNKIIIKRLNFYEKITPLIHLYCPFQLQCKQRIILQITPIILQKLQIVVYHTLAQNIQYNQSFQTFLNQNHNIIPHLALLITQSVIYTPLQQQCIIDQQQSPMCSSQPTIAVVLNILNQLLANNHDICHTLVSTPNFISSLIKLYSFKTDKHNRQVESENLMFRTQHTISFYWILKLGDASTFMYLSQQHYIKSLAMIIALAGGCGETNYKYITDILANIKNFFLAVYQGWDATDISTPGISSQLALVNSQECVEEEGCNEEIEANLFNQGWCHQFFNDAKLTKDIISNFFRNQTNQQPYTN